MRSVNMDFMIGLCICGILFLFNVIQNEFEKYRGYLLNQKMVEALMTEEVAKEAP